MTDLITPDFKDWYAKYPKKMARKDAEKAWKRLDDQEKLEAMMDDLDARYGHIDKQFIPYPATYIRGARWEDELVEVAQTPDIDEVEQFLGQHSVDPDCIRAYLNSRESTNWRKGGAVIVNWKPDAENFVRAYMENRK